MTSSMTKQTLRRWWYVLTAILGILVFQSEAFAWNPEVLRGRCKQTGNRCYSTVGNAGGQGACCDPVSRNIQSCEVNNTCSGGHPYRWPSSALPLAWYFNPNGMAGRSGYANYTANQIEAAFKVAWDSWIKPKCTSFRHSPKGQTTRKPTTRWPLVLYLPTPSEWAQMGVHSSVLAFTRPIPDSNGILQDADIYFNPAPGGRPWGLHPNVSRGQIDLVDVAAHEIGHALGFAHTNKRVLMYYAIRCYSGPCYQGLYRDEEDAICFTYKRTGPCQKDSDCGGCQKCSNGQCVDKNIPLARNICKPCTGPSDCGGLRDICIRMEEGNRCAQACDAAGCCPKGYRCTDIGSGQKMCVPDLGACPPVRCSSNAQCGPGESCQSGTCRPKPVYAHPKSCKKCSSNADCGGNGNVCLQFSATESRCAQPCAADNFCPKGYICRSASGGRFCVPDNMICPCSSNADCDSGYICRSGTCQKSGGGKFGDPCNEKTPCAPNHICAKTQSGSICIQPCGRGGAAAGSPGSSCTSSGTCTQGGQCFKLQNGGTICMPKSCPNGYCGGAGKCYRIQQPIGNRCLCTSDRDCGGGQICNKSMLSQLFRQSIGACANRSSAAKCESGYECQDASQQSRPPCNPSKPDACYCLPGRTQGLGEACGNKRCKQGLLCILPKQGATQGICVEDCTKTNNCSYGGICQQAGNSTKVCICQSSAQCGSGRVCSPVGNFGICKSGGSGCGNNRCDPGENCSNCPKDCACTGGKVCRNGTCQSPSPCGNGLCEGAKGENCSTCPKDCGCGTGKICQNGVCKAAQACGNGLCEGAKGENCSTCPRDCGCGTGKVCQNGVCKEPSPCGNGLCEGAKGENCSTCPKDCGCGTGKICQNGVCKVAESCGNHTCESVKGENCSSCPQDCGCGVGLVCQNGVCVTPQNPPKNGGNQGEEPKANPNCPVADQVKQCDGNGHCEMVCPEPAPKGCACNSQPASSQTSFLFLFLALFLLFLPKKTRMKK